MGEKLGQHFLINPEIARKIVEILSPQSSEHILEIGPGEGFLTNYLIETGLQVTGVEIDTALAEYLKKKQLKKLEIVNADFLRVELDTHKYEKICGNVPYQISGKIIEKIALSYLGWKKAVLMIPSAVAKRVVAVPGESDYSALSVMCGANCDAAIEFDVGKENFNPEPSIKSSVVSFRRKGEPYPENFYKFVRVAFGKKRKKLRNSLSLGFSITPSVVDKVLEKCVVPEKNRAQELTIEDFMNMTREFEKEGIL